MQNALISRIREFYFINGLASARGENACPDAFEHYMLRKADINDMPKQCVFDGMDGTFSLAFTGLSSGDVNKFKNHYKIESSNIKHDQTRDEYTFILSVRDTWNAFEAFKKSFQEKLLSNPNEVTKYISTPMLIAAIMMSMEGLENVLDYKSDSGELDKEIFDSYNALQKTLATVTLVQLESMRSNSEIAIEVYKGFEEVRAQWDAFLKAHPEVKDLKDCRDHVTNLDNQLKLAIAKLSPMVNVQTPKQWRGMRFLERDDVKQTVERVTSYSQEMQRMTR